MPRLQWNFTRRAWWISPWVSIGIIALMGCMHAVWWRADLLQRRAALIDLAQEASRRAAAIRSPVSATIPPAINQIFAEMRYPWNDVLDSLQHATRPNLDLLTVEPEVSQSRRVHITGVAQEADDVLDFVTNLQSDRSWSSVQLVDETRKDDVPPLRAGTSILPGLPGMGQRGVSFSLVAEWGRP